MARADVRVRVRRGVIQVDTPRPAKAAVVPVAAHKRRKSTQRGLVGMGVPIINIAFRGLPAPGPPVVRYADRGMNERREPMSALPFDAAQCR